MCSAPILSLSRDQVEYVIDCDASDFALGSVLQQRQDGKLRVIAYASRSFSSAEKQYCTTRKELLAVIYSLVTFRNYVLSHRFTLRCDHQALTSLLKCREPLGQQARWLDLISEFDFEIVFHPGISHQNADVLSQRPCARDHLSPCKQCSSRRLDQTDELQDETDKNINVNACTVENVYDVFAVTTQSSKPSDVIIDNLRFQQSMQWSPDILASEQQNDPTLSPVIQLLLVKSEPPLQCELNDLSNETQQLCHQWESLCLFNNVLYREFIDATGKILCYQLVVPETMKIQLIKHVHGSVTAGHWCAQRTLENLRKIAYWGTQRRDVYREVANCIQCNKSKRFPNARKSELKSWPACRVW